MKTYKGTIGIVDMQAGSRSDGRYAELTLDETERRIRLCRSGVYAADDRWFDRFDGCHATVVGVKSHGWLTVSSIEPDTERTPEAPSAPETENKEEPPSV